MVQHSPLNKCNTQFIISSYDAVCDARALNTKTSSARHAMVPPLRPVTTRPWR